MVLALLVLATAAAADEAPGRIGPSLGMTANGRLLRPAGRQTPAGNFPAGGALSPNGRFYWAVDAGNGRDEIQVVDVATGVVTAHLPLPGASGGVAFAPDGRRAYVSGTPKGGPAPDGPTKGDEGDVVHVFNVDPATGAAVEADPIALPQVTGGSGQKNSIPPVSGDYPQELAVSPDGAKLAVALTLADAVVLVDLKSGATRSVNVGAYPFGVAFSPHGELAYVSNQYDGTVSVVDVAAGTELAAIGVGGKGGDQNAHPQGVVADPRRDRVYVAVASRDLVAVIDTKTRKLKTTISVARSAGIGTEPTALALSPDGATLYAADSNEDAIAAIALGDRPGSKVVNVVKAKTPRILTRLIRRHSRKLRGRAVRACGGPSRARETRYLREVRRALARHDRRAAQRAYRRLPRVKKCAPGAVADMDLIGRIPTAAYPTAVAVTPDGKNLVWLSGMGSGLGPNPAYSFYGSSPYGTHLQDLVQGSVGVLARPSDAAVRRLSPRADAAVRPANATTAPAGTPLRKGGPIKHVFYIVRENRTYDQIFGSEPRGDGDPQLELFDDNGVSGPTGGVTPNAHALARLFPLLDHVYSDSQVSNDGHVVTTSAYATDYNVREVQARGRGLDEGVFPVSFPPNWFVFDQAARQNVSFRIYGEQSGGTTPFGADGRSTYGQVTSSMVNGYPTNVQIDCLGGTPFPGAGVITCGRDAGAIGATNGGSDPTEPAVSRFQVFQADFEREVAAGTVPTFNYLILPNDHTNGGRANARTPKALVADNDLGLGQIVQEISSSSIWAQSAIVVVEDDTQDGADHVDAHRMPAFVISPYARKGAVVHTRYDQYSALRTVEILAGLDPLNLNDALATPMYDAFIAGSDKPDVAGTRYTAIQPEQNLAETNPASGANARISAAMPLDELDMTPSRVLDAMLWHSVFGDDSTPPAPGPNASPAESARATGALRVYRRHGNVRAWLNARSEPDDDG